MSIEKREFGKLPTGEAVTKYVLANEVGMELHVADYGATVTSILIPNGDGTKDDVACGFDSVEGYFTDSYLANAPFFGSTVGRYCSTIKDAKYQDVKLTANCDVHNLHGGTVGFDKRMWGVKSTSCEAGVSSITFELVSEDGDQGFPGRVEAEVTMSLDAECKVSYKYSAVSDKRTPFTMTNHTYYNLSGFRESVEGHTIQVDSTIRIPLNFEGTYAESRQSVAGGADDLTEAKVIGDVHAAMGDGFEHYFLYSDALCDAPRKVLTFAYPAMGRSVEVATTEYGGLFYTGKFTSDELRRESGAQFGKFRGLCVETHRIPNGPNLEGAPNVMVEAGERYSSETTFKFKF